MAGVAGPMLQRTRSGGARFLAGLAAGSAAAGLLLSLPVYLVGTALQAVLPVRERTLILAGVCAVLGGADLLLRTPHPWRQVPERLVWTLPPGLLGVTWGFDLGLLFTTQKTTSLIWVGLAALLLLAPSSAAGVLIGVAVMASLVIAVSSFTTKTEAPSGPQRELRWFRTIRRTSGVTILALFVVTTAQALHL